ncbi:MAG TPA: DUF3750 domain-containing protein [Coxiellaceae bacterium]|nr:DUF3750 domain-containing protein [Coxiellaceae bacterium]
MIILDLLFKILFISSGLFIVLLIGPLWMVFFSHIDLSTRWEIANRDSAHLAPLASENPEAIVQVYGARAFHWRGFFAVHTWISAKPKNAPTWTVFQVVGWYRYREEPVLRVEEGVPDRYWFGNKPEIYNDIRGERAEKIIPLLKKYSKRYPYKKKYILWPGPNSNSYIAYLGRRVKGLELNLPASAIGKDYLVNDRFFARAPSHTGYQISLHGLLGITVARVEGIQFNFLGLSFGAAWHKGLVIQWPGIGEIRMGKINLRAKKAEDA